MPSRIVFSPNAKHTVIRETQQCCQMLMVARNKTFLGDRVPLWQQAPSQVRDRIASSLLLLKKLMFSGTFRT